MTILNKSSLLERLIYRGDRVSVVNGQLFIQPISNIPIPSKWLVENRISLMRDIAILLGLDIYQYDSYSTGAYGKHKCEGITLQFIHLRTGKEAYALYNASLIRARSSKNYKAGSRLPEGQFRITAKHLFYKFWYSTELIFPPRLSSFHDYMGNLKQIFFIPKPDHKGKITEKIIPLLNASYEEIHHHLANKSHTSNIQQPDKRHTNLPYKQIATPVEASAIEAYPTTSDNKYGLSYHGSEVLSNSIPITHKRKRPQDQTNDEWLNEFDNS